MKFAIKDKKEASEDKFFMKMVNMFPPYVTVKLFLNSDYVHENFLINHAEDGEKRYQSTQAVFMEAIDYGEIITLGKTFEKVIMDTKSPVHEVKLPYNSFFINKYFRHENFLVSGVAITKMFDHLIYSYLIFDVTKTDENDWGFYMGISKKDEFTDMDANELFVDGLSDEQKDIANEFFNEISRYIRNTINLLTMESPDIKFVKIDPSKDKLRSNESRGYESEMEIPLYRPTLNLRVSGETEKVIKEYNKLSKSKKFKKQRKGGIVRGHWRHLRSDFYKEKRVIWIPPHARGKTKEILHKFINVEEEKKKEMS